MREAKPRRVGTRWQIRVTDEHGKRRKKLFEVYGDTVKALVAEQARVAEVKDGLREPTPANRTFDQLADYWILPLERTSPTTSALYSALNVRRFRRSMDPLSNISEVSTSSWQAQRPSSSPGEKQTTATTPRRSGSV